MKKFLAFAALFAAVMMVSCGGQYKKSDETTVEENQYDVMLDEFASKVDRIIDLIYDMSESDNPFAYTRQIETLAAECEQLEKQLNAAPLTSSQKAYKDEIKAELEDTIRRLSY